MLDENKTYRTRDGIRTGIRVKMLEGLENEFGGLWYEAGTQLTCTWYGDGRLTRRFERPGDLIEEQPADRPFSYDACPMHTDGRRRAVTRDGREVVLLCDDAPGTLPIVGFVPLDARGVALWYKNGKVGTNPNPGDLLVPPPLKRVVWVNLYDSDSAPGSFDCLYYGSQEAADAAADSERLGNRAFPIEID